MKSIEEMEILLRKALYILNGVDLAFQDSARLGEMNFQKTYKPVDGAEPIRVFLCEYIRKDTENFIKNTERLLKQ